MRTDGRSERKGEKKKKKKKKRKTSLILSAHIKAIVNCGFHSLAQGDHLSLRKWLIMCPKGKYTVVDPSTGFSTMQCCIHCPPGTKVFFGLQ